MSLAGSRTNEVGRKRQPYFFGGMSNSLAHLPHWYQIIALSGVFVVIYLRNNPVIGYIILRMRTSFGTEAIWVPGYKYSLQNMTFTERLCFTLYGAGLGCIVTLVYIALCTDRLNLGKQATQLLPDRRTQSILLIVLMCVVEAFRLRCVITTTLEDSSSLAYIALHNYEGIENSPFESSIAGANPHFVIQFELLKAFLYEGWLALLPVFVVAVLYRLARDVPRRVHMGTRWYLATISYVLLAREAFGIFVEGRWADLVAWATIIWCVALLGSINYIYGRSKRAGMVVTASSANAVAEALRGFACCGALWVVSNLLVLAIVVSVHEELVAIWVLISLLILWIPAVTDSCSIDYLFFLSCGAGYVAYGMGSVGAAGGARFAALFGLWWLAVCLLYNAALLASQSRYVATPLALWAALWFMTPPSEVLEKPELAARLGIRNGAAGLTGYVTARLMWFCDVADYRELVPESWLFTAADGDGEKAFHHSIQSAILLCIFCLVVVALGTRQLTDEQKLNFQRRDIVVVTPSLLLRKVLRTGVLVWCTSIAYLAFYVLSHYVLPHWAPYLPLLIIHGFSAVVGCTVLGALMDSRDSMYEGALRVIGLMEPPTEGSRADENDTSQREDLPEVMPVDL